MPNRILREAILDSQAVDNLTAPAEVFYRRLMSVVDDFGRFDARPSVLKARCYPLKLDGVREADISRWIAECEKAGLIVLYSHEDKPYMLFLKLGEPRAKTSKFPAPPADVSARAQTLSSANTRAHTRPYSYSGSDSPTNPISGSVSDAPTGAGAPTSDLVQRWIFAKKFGAPAGVHEVAAMLENLKAAGIGEPEILTEIDNPKRNRGEFTSQFAERMLRQHRPAAKPGAAYKPMSERMREEETKAQ